MAVGEISSPAGFRSEQEMKHWKWQQQASERANTGFYLVARLAASFNLQAVAAD